MADLNARTKINTVNMITQNALPRYSAGLPLIAYLWLNRNLDSGRLNPWMLPPLPELFLLTFKTCRRALPL